MYTTLYVTYYILNQTKCAEHVFCVFPSYTVHHTQVDSSAVVVAMKGGAWWAQKGGKPAAATSAAAASTEYKVSTKVANVNGTYKLSGNNHSRGIYQMTEGELRDSAEKPVIYYWDERDGAAAQGWWIGIGVGGAQV